MFQNIFLEWTQHQRTKMAMPMKNHLTPWYLDRYALVSASGPAIWNIIHLLPLIIITTSSASCSTICPKLLHPPLGRGGPSLMVRPTIWPLQSPRTQTRKIREGVDSQMEERQLSCPDLDNSALVCNHPAVWWDQHIYDNQSQSPRTQQTRRIK